MRACLCVRLNFFKATVRSTTELNVIDYHPEVCVIKEDIMTPSTERNVLKSVFFMEKDHYGLK